MRKSILRQKPFDKNVKRIFSVVLAFVLCFSIFSNNVLTACAQGKYTRTRFAFDFSSYIASLSEETYPKFKDGTYKYLYALHFHDEFDWQFTSSLSSGLGSPTVSYTLGVDSPRRFYNETFCFIFTDEPFVANYQYDTDYPVVAFGYDDSDSHEIAVVYISGNSATLYNGWALLYYKSGSMRMAYNSVPTYFLKYIYFNPYYCDVMSNVDICQYNNRLEILWEKCLSDEVLSTFKNTSTETDTGSGDTGNGSTGGTLVETGDLVEYDDTLGSLFHNISVIAQRIINLPYYIAENTADKLGLGSLFNLVTGKITDVGNYVLSLPGDIADKLGLDVHISNVLTKLASINTSIVSLADKWAQLPIEIGKELGTNDFFSSVLSNWVSLGVSLSTLPYDIAVEIGKDSTLADILSLVTDIPLNVGHEIGSILDDAGLGKFVELPINIGNEVGKKLEEIGLDWIVRFPLEIGKEFTRSLEDTHISDIPQKIEDSIDEISQNMKENTSDIVFALFVPGEGVIDAYISDIGKRFPFIESAHSNIQYLVNELELIDNSKSPVLTFSFSESSLATYGVSDVTVDFSWFAPYRSSVLSVESAFMYGLFAVRQFFGVKNMINATDSSVRIVARG